MRHPQSDGTVRHLPFHIYSMKQAIQEGFILDVLKHYTPIKSYYKLAKTVEEDPEFDVKKARKKLRRYVEGHEHAIRLKAEIMVDHFHEQVIKQRKVNGNARAMVVTNGIERAIQYFHSIRDYLKERKSPYQAIVAFSGEHEYGGEERERSQPERLSRRRGSPRRSRRIRTAFSSARTSSRPAMTNPSSILCTSTRPSPGSRRSRPSRGSIGRTRGSTTSSCSIS